MTFVAILSIFVMACFVGYYVVWSVTPALHTPLMAVTNAISSVIIVGALVAAAATATGFAGTEVIAVEQAPVAVDRAVAPQGQATVTEVVVADTVRPADTGAATWSRGLGLLAVVLASINIFGGFAVTQRMLAMYKRKDRPAPKG